MKTTFINCRTEDKTSFRKEGREHLLSRAEAFDFWRQHGTEVNNPGSNEQSIIDRFESYGSFYDYGLSVDYVVPGTFNNQREGYLRYHLSWGGPSEEVRFYYSSGAREAYKIEFVYMNWGTGVGFNVTEEKWARWLFNWFWETDTLATKQREAMEAN